MDAEETLTIGQLAAAAGVHVETVRYYERRGLLAEPPRTTSGYRQYGPCHVERLQFIGRAKRMGFTLAEIHDLVAAAGPTGDGEADGVTDRILAAARGKLTAIDQQVRELREARARLEQLVSVCATGATGDCATLNLAG